MKAYYLLANGQPNDRAIYYTGVEHWKGGEFWGNVAEAYKFETLDKVFEQIKYEGCTASPIIVEVLDCTLEVIKRGYEDCKNNVESTDRDVMNRYNTVSYITNSK